MLEKISGSYAGLSNEQREELAALLGTRIEYQEQLIEMNKRRIVLLKDYSPAGEEALKEFWSISVAPLRAKMSDQTRELVGDAVNIDGLKSMLPMALMALSGNVNLPLLLTALGVEPDQIEQIIGGASKYFQKGME